MEDPVDLKPMVRIAAFDPSSAFMGWSVIDYDPNTLTETVVAVGTMDGSKMLKQRKEMKKKFSKQWCILNVFEEHITENIFKKYQNHYTVCESAFYGSFVQTLISLTLVINVIRSCSYGVFGTDIWMVAPKEVKTDVTGKHEAKKHDIKDAIVKRETLQWPDTLNKDTLNEHEYDAIAHALCFIKRRLPLIISDEITPTSLLNR